jgi:hypothetical protein
MHTCGLYGPHAYMWSVFMWSVFMWSVFMWTVFMWSLRDPGRGSHVVYMWFTCGTYKPVVSMCPNGGRNTTGFRV